MGNFDAIRHNNRRQKRMRVTLSLTQSAYNEMLQLSEMRPEHYPSQIVGDCIHFAFANGVYDNPYLMRATLANVTGPANLRTTQATKSETVSKEEMCLRYGGRIDGATCYYDKYENLIAGGIHKSEQGLPLSQIPKNEEDFRKMVLGSFVSVAQAEVAYQEQVAQAKKVQVAPEVEEERDLIKIKKKK